MTEHLTGEQRERQRRRRFWGVLGVLAAVVAPIGGVIGYNAGKQGLEFTQALDTLSPSLLGWLAIFYAAALVIGSWRFVRVIDEVELADNLWASAAGFYCYAIAFPCWGLMAKAGWVAPVNGWILLVATYIVAMSTYAFRKWRAR